MTSSDSARVVDELYELATGESIDEVWRTLTAAVCARGFPRAVYGVTVAAHRDDFGRPDQITAMHNMPDEWADTMIGGRLFERSPALHWARRNVGMLSWGRLPKGVVGGPLARLNAEHGVTAGVCMSFAPSSLGDRAILCLISDPGAPQGRVNLAWDRHGREIEALAQVAHLRIMALPRQPFGVTLNRRQCEVLGLIGAGLSVAQTASRVGRTPKAVEKRLAEARRVLNAGSTAEAVVRAADLNLISVFGGRMDESAA